MRDGPAAGDDFEVLARMTARLASTANLDEICDTVLDEIVSLGFGAAWIAVLDECTGNLVTVREVIDDRDTTPEMPRIFMADVRQPIGVGFRDRRMVNVTDPERLLVLEDCDGQVPEGEMALPRVVFEHLRGNPFACGPVLGSRGKPVGALGLSSYRGHRPIPDEVLQGGLVRAFRDHLGIAMERALWLQRYERVNRDLVRAQERLMSDARLKAIGELAAAVAHDLNNLAGLALMAVSVGARSPDKAHEMLPRIERANRAIGDLVERLQRAAGRYTESADECVDLSELIDDVVLMLSPMCREASIRVVTDVDPALYVQGDRAALHQVVMNLVKNAYDALAASPDDSRREIGVTASRRDGEILVVVADSGPGVADDVIDRVFEPFVTSREGTHVGLGLAAAQAAVKHFGGSIKVRNRPEGGAAFSVTLSAASNEQAPATRSTARETAVPRPMRVLAIDDDEDVVYLIEQFLEPLGCETVGITDPDAGIERARREAFDIVLCDLGMPGNNGLDVCSTLRRQGCQSKLVLITGWEAASVSQDARFEHCDAILQKPFVGADIIEVVHRLFPSDPR